MLWVETALVDARAEVSWIGLSILPLILGVLGFGFSLIVAFILLPGVIPRNLVGYDGWLWRSQIGKVHLDLEPPEYRREPDGLLMQRTENGWDRAQHNLVLPDGVETDDISIGPIVPYGVGWLRRWRERRNPQCYYMQYFDRQHPQIIRVSTRDGESFRMERRVSGTPAIEGPLELIMSVLMRNLGGQNIGRMIREPERIEDWYRALMESVHDLREVIADRKRVKGGRIPGGKLRQYLDEIDRVFGRERTQTWQTGLFLGSVPGNTTSRLLDDLFPPQEKDDPASRGVGQPDSIAQAGEYE